MECPVCLNKKGSKYMFNLECNHKLCIPCSIQWLATVKHQMTCPLCRNPTEIFEKHTRSNKESHILCIDAIHTYRIYIEIYNSQIPMHVFTNYITYFFIKHKHLWFRPRPMTRPFLNLIKQTSIDGILLLNNIIDNNNPDQYAQLYYLEHHKQLLLNFIKTF